MNPNNEEDNKAVLSVLGALIDHLAQAGIIDRAELARHIEYAASAHQEAGEISVADSVRWLSRALLDDETLNRMTTSASPLPQ